MLTLEDLYKEFKSEGKDVRAVNHVNFNVPEGKFFTLLGPSGCGKTTTLRCIAGLERPDSGKIILDGNLISSDDFFLSPDKRNIGMVFQSYAIWPHMDVFSNVAFPLKVCKTTSYSKAEIEKRVKETLHIVQLDGLEKRPATKLSGGQQQRLALARALVRQPKLLLLDEPLSNLDAILREDMRVELRQMQQRLGLTTIYVTHDQLEALALSDTIAVMNGGVIEQMGSPQEIYQKPASRFIAGFIGNTNWLEGKVKDVEGDKVVHVETNIGMTSSTTGHVCKCGDNVMLSVRPEAIRVETVRPEGERYCEAQVESVMFLGEYIDCYLRIGEQVLRAKTHPQLLIKAGDKVYVQLLADYCVALAS